MVTETKDQLHDLDLYDLTQRMMRWWWVIVIFAIAGGLAGFLISRVQKPVYESDSVITTTIDYAYAGRLNDYMVDHLITAVGDVIDSSQVIDKVLEEAAVAGIDLSHEAIKEGLTKSRQGYRWVLSSRFHDPKLAVQINQLWLSTAVDALEELRLSSLQTLDKFAYQHAVESCFSQAVILDPSSAYCTVKNFQQLRLDIKENYQNGSGQSLVNQFQISKISFQVTQTPSIPDEPVLHNTNLATAAGCAAGLILAMIFFLSGYPRNRTQGK